MKAILLNLGLALVATCIISAWCQGEADMGQRERVRREMPNWSYWTSDFWGWVAQMRELGVQQPVRDLARTFWAHFPIATSLGYDASPDNE
uniref:otospiralin n=1 Tax=Myxine glutinosa TaxID=7769 RepID=UPI00358E103C